MDTSYQGVYGADPSLGSGGVGGPTGIPDPSNPGYDTAGYPLNDPSAGRTGPVTATHGGTTGSGGQPGGTAGNVGQPVPPAPPGGGGGGGGGIGTGILAPFSEAAPAFPTVAPFQEGPAFSAPSFEEALNNPGQQFRVAQGESALQNWAAARGTLNDSGTAKSLIDYGQAAGAQGYGDVYARDFNTWQANQDAARQAYGLNRMTQSIDPWTAAFNAWQQRGNFYLNNQGTAANAALGFAQL
jgi:hypothetical protein